MITYSLLAFTAGLAILSIFLFYRATRQPLKDAVFTAALSVSMALFIYLFGTWVFLSIYCKFAFGITYLVLALLFLWKRELKLRSGAVWYKAVFAILLSTASILYFTGTTGTPQTVELDFPLKKGRYFVLQGGKGLPTNIFHFSLRGAIYAMDIIKLNKNGTRGNHIFSKNLEDYAIYGDTIYSPCSDNIPPNMQRGPKNTNMVLIETDSFYVFMGHLKHEGVFVEEGDTVVTGQPLGRVGNSGFSTEPHLHIQVHAREQRAWYMSTPLYIHFNGKGYLLNEVIREKNL
jgi:hypothetical protein